MAGEPYLVLWDAIGTKRTACFTFPGGRQVGLHVGSRSLLTAVLCGLNAALRGEPETGNPYADKHGERTGNVTYSRSWAARWYEGWKIGHDELAAQREETGV